MTNVQLYVSYAALAAALFLVVTVTTHTGPFFF